MDKTVINVIKNKLFSKGAVHVIVGSFLTKFVSFFGSIFLVRILSKSDYGVLSYYENLISYFIILAGGGLASGLQRYIIIANTNEEKKACYNNAIRVGTIWNIGLVSVALLFFWFYPHPEAFNGYFAIALVLTMCIPFIYITNVSLSTLRAMFDYKGYAILAFITSFLLIAMRVIGALINGLLGTTLLKFICEIGCVCICIRYLYFKFFKDVKPVELSGRFIKERNIYSLQIMFTDGLWAIFMLNDIFLLGQLVGNEALVADYKVAYVIPANLSILTSAIGIFVAPYFTKKEKENNWAWINKNLKKILLINIAIMSVFSLVCFIFAKPIILLLYGEKYISCIPIMRLLLIASFFNNGVRATIANVFSAIGIQRINLFIAGGGMVLQIILDLVLIPTYGGFGVAYSSTTVYLFMSFALVVIFLQIIKKKRGVYNE